MRLEKCKLLQERIAPWARLGRFFVEHPWSERRGVEHRISFMEQVFLGGGESGVRRTRESFLSRGAIRSAERIHQETFLGEREV